MKPSFFLTVNKDGTVPKVTKQRPYCAPNQAVVAMTVEVPDSYFLRPAINACVKVPDPKTPEQLDADIVGQIEEAVQAATGLDLNITISYPKEENTND